MASTSYGVFAVLVIFVENDQSLSHNWSVLHKAVHPNSCTRLRATYNCVSRNKPEDPTSGTMASTSYGVFAVLVIFVENDQSLSHNWSVLHKAVHPNSCTRLRATYNCVSRNKPEDPTSGTMASTSYEPGRPNSGKRWLRHLTCVCRVGDFRGKRPVTFS
ncbi:hypothetical protein OS493_011044 [Desmophyllum pertusum]|uniref:Uncharacterized protein n=1 Tax=Desmophyllum pertusum TaxID=174260 RepID=A0A9X0CY65_9CNID|nr:hypothetical protein OS493_011044 [Desmophyllum pertusum]